MTATVLGDFAIRLGARRRGDTANVMSAFPGLAELLNRQAAVIGAAQISVIDAKWDSFARRMGDVAALHVQVAQSLRSLV